MLVLGIVVAAAAYGAGAAVRIATAGTLWREIFRCAGDSSAWSCRGSVRISARVLHLVMAIYRGPRSNGMLRTPCSWRFRMSRIGCVMVLTMGLLLAVPPAHAQDAAKIARGQQVYVAQKCAVCHSIAGKGNAKGTLDGVGA